MSMSTYLVVKEQREKKNEINIQVNKYVQWGIKETSLVLIFLLGNCADYWMKYLRTQNY